VFVVLKQILPLSAMGCGQNQPSDCAQIRKSTRNIVHHLETSGYSFEHAVLWDSLS